RDRARVGASTGLREAERPEHLAPAHAREPLPLLLLGPEPRDRPRAEPDRRLQRDRDGGVDARELLDREAERLEVGSLAAVFLRERDAEQAHLAHASHDIERELLALVVLGGVGGHDLEGELPDGGAELLLLRRQVELHAAFFIDSGSRSAWPHPTSSSRARAASTAASPPAAAGPNSTAVHQVCAATSFGHPRPRSLASSSAARAAASSARPSARTTSTSAHTGFSRNSRSAASVIDCWRTLCASARSPRASSVFTSSLVAQTLMLRSLSSRQRRTASRRSRSESSSASWSRSTMPRQISALASSHRASS